MAQKFSDDNGGPETSPMKKFDRIRDMMKIVSSLPTGQRSENP
jgi:hypothetical protein